MAENVDSLASASASASLPRPYKINGRFVIPWPGFKLPGAAGVMKFIASSEDFSNIPPREVPVTFSTEKTTFFSASQTRSLKIFVRHFSAALHITGVALHTLWFLGWLILLMIMPEL